MTDRLAQMIKRLLLSLALITTAHADWEALPPLPVPNGGCICGSDGPRVVVIGGTNWEGGVKNWLTAIHEFDPAKKRWEKVKDLQEGAYAYGTSYQDGLRLAFMGGTDGKKPRRIFGFVDGIKTVMTKELELPAAVVLAAGGYLSGKYILVGGTDDAANLAGLTRLTHAFVPATQTITRLTDFPGKPFAVAASTVARDELFVFGGMNYDAEAKAAANTDTAYAFSPAKNTWRALKPLAQPNRGLSAIPLDETHLYLAGGFTDDFTAAAVIYDVTTDSYRPAKPLPYAAMVGLVKHAGFVYCLGGEDKKQSRTDNCFRIPIEEL